MEQQPQNLLGDRYQPIQLLGKKAGRQTWLAQDLQTQQSVVVKLLTFSADFEWQDLKLFEREAQILNMLDHPAIPRYLDYFDISVPQYQGFALVQTYIAARSLEQHIKDGRTFSEAELKEIAQKLLEILIELHSHNPSIIHRDIKPSNILLTDRSGNSVGQLYLVDFGSVQTTLRQDGTITIVGTYGYMPPEQFSGNTTPASDLYGLGATLIYLASGLHPADLPSKTFRIQFEDRVQISPFLKRWLRKLIEPDLEQRFPSAEATLSALQTWQLELASMPERRSTNSQIKFSKSAEAISISIPNPDETAFGLGCLPLCVIALGAGLLPSLIPGTDPLGKLFVNAILALCGTLIVQGLVIGIFKSFFPNQLRLNLYIDRTSLSWELKLFNRFRTQLRQAPTHEVSRLELVPMQYQRVTHNNTPDTYKLVNPTITIWAGKQSFQLSGLKDSDIDWIVAELRDWLDVPVESRAADIQLLLEGLRSRINQ